ncbi:MAG: VOC family protein, partial [bacterium]|nr:VOC family protein [bacterium]
MELDHIFFLIEPGGPEPGFLERPGLRESYRRDHPGQGTQNACYCFDNIYIELLWVNDPAMARSKQIARTKLLERSTWRSAGTCPIGLAWRSGEGDDGFGGKTWDYCPPYLPDGAGISVSVDSDDPCQPMLFRSPGTSGPLDWPLH